MDKKCCDLPAKPSPTFCGKRDEHLWRAHFQLRQRSGLQGRRLLRAPGSAKESAGPRSPMIAARPFEVQRRRQMSGSGAPTNTCCKPRTCGGHYAGKVRTGSRRRLWQHDRLRLQRRRQRLQRRCIFEPTGDVQPVPRSPAPTTLVSAARSRNGLRRQHLLRLRRPRLARLHDLRRGQRVGGLRLHAHALWRKVRHRRQWLRRNRELRALLRR